MSITGDAKARRMARTAIESHRRAGGLAAGDHPGGRARRQRPGPHRLARRLDRRPPRRGGGQRRWPRPSTSKRWPATSWCSGSAPPAPARPSWRSPTAPALLRSGRGRPADRDAAGGGGRRAAGLPAGRPHREGRPLHGPGVGGAHRYPGGRGPAPATRPGRDRGRPHRLHARSHPDSRLRHRRRGPEHLAPADEDGADPDRRGLAHGRDRRSQPGRPGRIRTTPDWRTPCRILEHVEGVAIQRFTSADVVRHPLVGRIVKAYDADAAQRTR